MNNSYSNQFHLSLLPASPSLVQEVRYANGTTRKIGYDSQGVPNSFIDIDGTVWAREVGTSEWVSDNGDSFFGAIEVVPKGSKDGVAGSISVRVYDCGFVILERIFFPIGIAVESRFSRDRIELERHVRLLNGRDLRFRRESRNALWFQPNGDVAHLPENPCQYGLPWLHPAVAMAIA